MALMVQAVGWDCSQFDAPQFAQNGFGAAEVEVGRCQVSGVMRRFSGIEPGDDHISNETTSLNFLHLLARHRLTDAHSANLKHPFCRHGHHPVPGNARRHDDH